MGSDFRFPFFCMELSGIYKYRQKAAAFSISRCKGTRTLKKRLNFPAIFHIIIDVFFCLEGSYEAPVFF